MNIVSWNTNGLRATAKQGFFLPLFKKGKIDLTIPARSVVVLEVD